MRLIDSAKFIFQFSVSSPIMEHEKAGDVRRTTPRRSSEADVRAGK